MLRTQGSGYLREHSLGGGAGTVGSRARAKGLALKRHWGVDFRDWRAGDGGKRE